MPTFLAWNDILLRDRQADEMTKNIFRKGDLVVHTIDKVSIDEEVHQESEDQHYPDAEHHENEADAEDHQQRESN